MPRHPSRGPGLPHGVTKGPGLGGPARGASTSATPESLPLYEPGNKAAENRTGGSAYRRMAKEERIATLTEMAFEIAEAAQLEAVKSGMVQYLMNREMGTPLARTIAATTDDLSDLDDTALEQRRAEIERRLREASPGAAQETDPEEL